MLLRELVRRHVADGERVALAADPALFPDLARACRWTAAHEWSTDTAPAAVLLDLSDADQPSEALQPWAARWPEVPTWLLVHTEPAATLPVGPLVGAARAQGLHLVEAVALPGRHKLGIVASREPRALLGYLNGHAAEVPDGDATARITWEWALAGLVQRARETEAEAALANVTAQRDALREQLQVAKERAQAREERLRQSASFVLGQHLVALRAHPLAATRALLADGRRLRKDRRKA